MKIMIIGDNRVFECLPGVTLGKIMDDDTIAELGDLYGEGGATAASALLVEKLQTKFPNKYKEMVTNLNNLKKKRN